MLSIQPLRVHRLSSASCCQSSRFESTICPVLRVVNPAASSPPSVQCFVLSIQPLRVHHLSSASCCQSSRFESTICPVLRVVNPAASSPPSVQCFVLSIQPLRVHRLSSASCCQSSRFEPTICPVLRVVNPAASSPPSVQCFVLSIQPDPVERNQIFSVNEPQQTFFFLNPPLTSDPDVCLSLCRAYPEGSGPHPHLEYVYAFRIFFLQGPGLTALLSNASDKLVHTSLLQAYTYFPMLTMSLVMFLRVDSPQMLTMSLVMFLRVDSPQMKCAIEIERSLDFTK